MAIPALAQPPPGLEAPIRAAPSGQIRRTHILPASRSKPRSSKRPAPSWAAIADLLAPVVKFRPMPLTRTTVLPRVAPIVPTVRRQAFNHPAWIFEPKYDGFRGMLYLNRRGCTLYSKRGNVMRRFQDLAGQVRSELPHRELILDGEIIALDAEGRINFWDLMRGRGTLAYAAFDILWLDGRDLRAVPLAQRKRRLERLIPVSAGSLNRVPSFAEEGGELFDAACRLDLEGIVAKRTADPYSHETAWYKIKNPTYTQAEGRAELFERH